MALRETLRHSSNPLARGLGGVVTGATLLGEAVASELRSRVIDDKVSDEKLAGYEARITKNYSPPEPFLRRSADAFLYENDGAGRTWVP